MENTPDNYADLLDDHVDYKFWVGVFFLIVLILGKFAGFNLEPWLFMFPATLMGIDPFNKYIANIKK